jgi:outer membrane protein assembly factor BamD
MRNSLVLTLVITFLIYLTGCSTTPVDENDPASLLKDAESEIHSDHYQIAIDKLRIVKNKFPYSKYAVDAQLRIADVYFLQESYAEAAASYEAFRDLHPKHEKTAYAMFRASKSYMNDSPGNVARDLSSARKAMDSYSDFLKRFPGAPEADEAQKDMLEVRRLLAEKELYIADFYNRRDFYDSAKPRYKKIIDLYPETEAAKEARSKIASMPEAREPSKDARTSGQP